MLVATEDGEFPVLEWGKTDPTSKIKLKKDEIWKYGTTVNPETRYTQKWLRENKLRKVRQDKGSKKYVLGREGFKIMSYFTKHGKLPPGNKGFK